MTLNTVLNFGQCSINWIEEPGLTYIPYHLPPADHNFDMFGISIDRGLADYYSLQTAGFPERDVGALLCITARYHTYGPTSYVTQPTFNHSELEMPAPIFYRAR